MTLPAFATHTDLAARWRTLTTEEQTRADVLLADASDLIREAADWQQISLVADDTVDLTAYRSRQLVLPQRPVISVATVDGVATDPRTWIRHGARLQRTDGDWWDGTVTVVYSHGLNPLPRFVIGMCCDLVKRAMQNPDSLHSEVIGSYQYRLVDEAQPGRVYLTPDEEARVQQAFGNPVGVSATGPNDDELQPRLGGVAAASNPMDSGAYGW